MDRKRATGKENRETVRTQRSKNYAETKGRTYGQLRLHNMREQAPLGSRRNVLRPVLRIAREIIPRDSKQL